MLFSLAKAKQYSMIVVAGPVRDMNESFAVRPKKLQMNLVSSSRELK